MIIKKEYKFYAAHRNQLLEDKCSNLHGHRYGLSCFFNVTRNGDITTLFGDFDKEIEPFLKRYYDHGLLIDIEDPLYQYLCAFEKDTDTCLKMVRFPHPTSVENLCQRLFGEITDMGFNLDRIEVKETDSSTVIYTYQDWLDEKGEDTC